ncbi:MAG: lipopolysaccharide biosynthesis protein [Gemmatimonadota bacterium]|nr:lipopolysaccharide biosynthesis protein [Gemmatimonadota bacterium]
MTLPPTPAAPPSATFRRELDRSLVRGIAWTGGAKWLTQTLRWASTLLIARLLTPADYGLVGYATVYLGLVSMVSEFGLGAAIVQQRDLGERQIARLGGVSVLLGAALAALTVAMSWPVASFFGEPRVQLVLAVLGVMFLVRGIRVVPRSLLNRDLRFRHLAWVDGTEAVTLTLTTLVLAYLGFGYWSLVWGSVAGAVAGTVVAVAWAHHRIAWPGRLRGLRASVAFGWHVSASRVLWYVYSNADFVVVGRMLGTAALGAYSFAWTIANIPVERVSAVVGRVTLPVFANVQRDHASLRRYFLMLTEGLAIITFPVAIGLALVAREFVLVVLGPQWSAAVLPMALLVGYSGFRSITLLFPQILVAMGQARRNVQFNLIAALILPILFVIGAMLGGTVGVALAWIVGFPIVYVPFFMRHTFRTIELRVGQYLRALWPALSGTLAMAAVVVGIKVFVPDAAFAAMVGGTAVSATGAADTGAMAARLAVEAVAGTVTYVAVLGLAHRVRVLAFMSAFRLLAKR